MRMLFLLKNGKTVYFTRNNSNDGVRAKNDHKISTLKIYKAELIDGKWRNITALPFNSDNYSVEHPALFQKRTNYIFLPMDMRVTECWMFLFLKLKMESFQRL